MRSLTLRAQRRLRRPERTGKQVSSSYRDPCKVKRAAHDSGARTARSIRLVVLHSAEGTSAQGVANHFARSDVQASTQLAVDDNECYRMLPDLVVPWGAPGANSDGLHVEFCGYARWERSEWLEHESMLQRTAWKVAKWCWQYGISPRYLNDKQLASGTARGIVTHVQVSRVFKRSTHWDPGEGFPLNVFLRYVKEYFPDITAERDK